MKKTYSFILLSFSLLFYFFTNANFSFAQTESAQVKHERLLRELEAEKSENINPQALPLNTNPDVPQNLSTYTQSVFIEILGTASCFLGGQNIVFQDEKCLGIDPETRKIGYIEDNQGAVGLMGNLIAATYNIPASSGDYIRYMAGNFGITRNAYAVPTTQEFCNQHPELCAAGMTPSEYCGYAPESSLCTGESSELGLGVGFSGLEPLMGIWTAMRNIVYLLFVAIFIILGLGIMFRLQIDPRAVLSIQSQLPRIVIALILVTFSYAIAGFLIDLMYLSLFLIINIFDAQGLEASTTLATNPINATGGLGGIHDIAYDAAGGVTSVINSLFDGTFGKFFRPLITILIGGGAGAVGGHVGIIVGGVIGATWALGSTLFGVPDPFTIAIGAIAWLIIVIALLSALFRLWFTLIKTYVFILIDVVFAPIWIAFGLIPGSSLNFSGWIRSLASNLATFPLVLVLFSLGGTLQDSFSNSGPQTFVPPYIGDPGDMSVFASLIGMGIILLAPEAVNMTKAAFKAPESKFAGAVGRSIGVGQGIVGGGISSAKNALWYTNPHTGEAGRLKGFAGEKVKTYMDKIPLVKSMRERYKTDKQKMKDFQEQDELDKWRESQKQRTSGGNQRPSSLNDILTGNDDGNSSQGA